MRGALLRKDSVVALSAALLAAGCSSDFRLGQPRVVAASKETVYEAQAVHWSRKPRIAVMEFEDKTGIAVQAQVTSSGVTVQNPIGRGMKEQLVTALAQTGAFIILEREALEDVMREQELGHSGRFRRETAARIGELEGAELLVYGAVTAYKPSQASFAAGGGVDPLLGAAVAGPAGVGLFMIAQKALGFFMKQDYVAIDLRLVDANTGRVVAATAVEATPRDFGGVGGGIFGNLLFMGAAQYSTPIQKAIRACTAKAVEWIAENAMARGLLRQGEAPAVAAGPAPSTELREAQAALNELGYDCGVPDGLYGRRTARCIEAFQRDQGLAVTGRLDEATRGRIEAVSAARGGGAPAPRSERGSKEWFEDW